MAVSLKTNLPALNALRRVEQWTRELGGIYDHLSSGLRITRPSDDAAGLSISSNLKADERVYSQGIKNINDGISMLNTAEGALRQLSNIVIRQRELAEQAANGVYSGSQRLALHKEANALVQEFNRITRSTEFNGQKIIDGISDSLTLQQGYGSNESTTVSLSQQLGTAAGTGNLQETTSGIATTGRGIAAGDINGDGVPDLITAANGSYILAQLGTGSGTFTTGYSFATSQLISDMRLGDMNGDGKLDIVALDDSGVFSIFSGNGNGTFLVGSTAATVTPPSNYQQDFTLEDLNGDGALDIAVGLDSGGLGVILGNGNGTFRAPRTIGVFGTGVSNVETADLNGDGIMDIIAGGANSSGNRANILLGNGDGTYRLSGSYSSTNRTGVVAIADFNNDGIKDFIAGSQSGAFQVYLGNGNGTFRTGATFTDNPSTVASIRVADFNGDGALDFATGFDNGVHARIVLGNGNGTFLNPLVTSIGGRPNILAVSDFNGDGIPDLAGIRIGSANAVAIGLQNTSNRRNNFAYELNLLTSFGAREALDRTSALLTRISRELGAVGALQSRLGYSVANLATRRTNYADAGGRITDTDMAETSAALVKTRILQQASSAVLSQSINQSRIALNLLP